MAEKKILMFKVECEDGELTVMNCRPIHSKLLESVMGCDAVVVDMGDVAYVDSSGINMLLSLSKHVKNVHVFGLRRQPTDILAATGLGKLVKTYETAQEAVDAADE